MRYNITFDYAACAVLFVLLVYYYRKRKAALPTYRQFHILLVVTLLLGITDFIVFIMYRKPSPGERALEYCVNVVDLMLQLYIMTGYCNYMLISLLKKGSKDNFMKGAVYIPLAVMYVLVLISAIFSYGAGHEAMVFRGNRILTCGFIAAMIYCALYAIVLYVRFGKNEENRKKIRHMDLTFVILLLIQFVQMVDQQQRILPFFTAVCLVDMLYTVHRSNELFDSTGSMFKHVMMDQLGEALAESKSFTYIFVRIHDHKVLVESLGQDDTDFFLRQVSAFLNDLTPDGAVFRAAPDLMAFRTAEPDEVNRTAVMEEIRERFRMPWRYSMLETMLSASYVTALVPEEITSVKVMRQLVNNITREEQEIDSVISARKYIRDDKDSQMLEAIRRGLRDGNFKVFYQPIYSTKKKKIIAAEALIRLFDPEYGSIPAEPMISLAEREGYILDIGRFVFEEVCRFYKDNGLNRMGVEYIEVNLSAVQCMQKSLAEEFMEIMRGYGITPDRINFEITETAAMTTNADVNRNISHFELHGIALSLDDYGTGYSNISYLYDMPFMIMKIDKSIMWSAETNEKAGITLENTYKMANRLHMKVVQEGVETEEQIKKLLKLGCDYFQGYYFSKPVEGEKFIEYVENFEVPGVCME